MWSRVFSEGFQMDGRQSLEKPPDGDTREEEDASTRFAFTKSVETWYVQRPSELAALCSYELLARFDATGGKYHHLNTGPPKVPEYVPFMEPRHSVVPAQLRASDNAAYLATTVEKHERYCEQRLVMFKPYRKRSKLLNGHESHAASLAAWLADATIVCRGKESVQYDMEVAWHRQEIVEMFGSAFGEPEEHFDPEEHEQEEGLDEHDSNDPLVALFGEGRPAAWVDTTHRAQAEHDWTRSTDFDLSPLRHNDEWLVTQKGNLGDDAVAPACSTTRRSTLST